MNYLSSSFFNESYLTFKTTYEDGWGIDEHQHIPIVIGVHWISFQCHFFNKIWKANHSPRNSEFFRYYHQINHWKEWKQNSCNHINCFNLLGLIQNHCGVVIIIRPTSPANSFIAIDATHTWISPLLPLFLLHVSSALLMINICLVLYNMIHSN